MYIAIIFFVIGIILLVIRFINLKKNENKKVFKFKQKHLSKETNIEKIFSRNDEKTSSDPNININIGLYENEDNINRKSNIHRARLSKFRKSKLNGEMIYLDQDQQIFKIIKGEKIYL